MFLTTFYLKSIAKISKSINDWIFPKTQFTEYVLENSLILGSAMFEFYTWFILIPKMFGFKNPPMRYMIYDTEYSNSQSCSCGRCFTPKWGYDSDGDRYPINGTIDMDGDIHWDDGSIWCK